MKEILKALKKIMVKVKKFFKTIRTSIKAKYYDFIDSLKPKQNQDFIKTENGIFKAKDIYYDELTREVRTKKYNIFLGKKL